MGLLDPNEKLAWLKSIKEEDIVKNLSNDTLLIYEECGIEVLIKLWEKFGGMPFYISNGPLNNLKRIYIKKNYSGDNLKRLAMELNVSQRFILQASSDSNGCSPDDPKLFPEI